VARHANNPITPQQAVEIDRALANLALTEDTCDRAGRCGLDHSVSKATAQLIRERLEAIKREFLSQPTGQPTRHG
jgi:hypothetical protein